MSNHEVQYLHVQQAVTVPAAFVGVGRYTNRRITMQVLPVGADHGIHFVRCDLPEGEGRFAATWDRAQADPSGITLHNPYGHRLAGTECLLAALHGLGIDNADVIVDGPELPVMDGSALSFVSGLIKSGIVATGVARDVIVVRRTVRVERDGDWAALMPDYLPRLSLGTVCPPRDGDGHCLSFCLGPIAFTRDIAPARAPGLSMGGVRQESHDAYGDARPVDRTGGEGDGRRFVDEQARHAILCTIADLALAGSALIGHYRSNRPGHALNSELLRLLMHDSTAWQRVAGLDLLSAGFDEPAATPSDIGLEATEPYTDIEGVGLRDRLGLRGIVGRQTGGGGGGDNE